jgi:hypothetical protein
MKTDTGASYTNGHRRPAVAAPRLVAPRSEIRTVRPFYWRKVATPLAAVSHHPPKDPGPSNYPKVMTIRFDDDPIHLYILAAYCLRPFICSRKNKFIFGHFLSHFSPLRRVYIPSLSRHLPTFNPINSQVWRLPPAPLRPAPFPWSNQTSI